ncbi:MAG: ribosome biogenesis GTPase YlqF [Bacilli bacterium]|nr:ribosome biogenesis GTPase YlqF [Bacilli bacterium]
MATSIIHWYPGHMKKAANKMLEALKMVDVVIELVDARAPIQTSNPFFQKIIHDKPCVKVYMKSDLADLSAVKLPTNGILLSIKDPRSLKQLTKKITDAYRAKAEKQMKRGIKPLPPKAMIVGIPNIGKSSLINALVKKKITKVENKPGLTKNQRWVNVNNAFYLLDTPGILPSNYDQDNYVLALIGAVKIELLPVIKLSDYAYTYIAKHYPLLFKKHYGEIKKDSNEAFALIANKRGIKNDKTIHHEDARSLFLKEIRDGKIGRIYFA